MIRLTTLRGALLGLLAAALLLLITLAVLLGLGRMLAGMGDLAGGQVLDRIALACGILLTIDLISLVLVQAVASLGEPRRSEKDDEESV